MSTVEDHRAHIDLLFTGGPTAFCAACVLTPRVLYTQDKNSQVLGSGWFGSQRIGIIDPRIINRLNPNFHT